MVRKVSFIQSAISTLRAKVQVPYRVDPVQMSGKLACESERRLTLGAALEVIFSLVRSLYMLPQVVCTWEFFGALVALKLCGVTFHVIP